MKFLNHLWNFQNQYIPSAKKSKTYTNIKDEMRRTKLKKKSFLNNQKDSYLSTIRNKVKLIDLIDLINSLNMKRAYSSIR